ncbi:MAG: adenosylmethionine--8-amino-7-oxononanoate transaminase [Myxococcales bacterium]|nr:adenosylmethionine--8-amino-7-oxononanoate transaminase [Myxococcales bacterium]
MTRAEGPYLYAEDGRRYLDGSGAWWCNNLGHGHPRLREALVRQAQDMLHCSMAGTAHPAAVLLAEELVTLAPPGLTRVFYSDNGSTSVEVALKMAFQFWQQNGRPSRTRFLALPGGYHGDTVGAMSVGNVGAFNGLFAPLFPGGRAAAEGLPEPAHADDEAGWDALFDALEDTLRRDQDQIAGVIVEPMIQGAAGMRTYPARLLRRLREVTRAVDTFLICDEVFTGLGRTGAMWASTHADITPDLLCTAKGLSGGALPFSATLATERVFDGFRGDKTRALMHGHTFYGNPLGAAVAREVLAIYRDEQILERSQARCAQLATGFEALARLPGVKRTRALGMVAAADLGDGGYLAKLGWAVHDEARARGAQLRPLGDTVYVVPPLNITEGALDELLSVVHASVAAALETQRVRPSP